MGQSAGFGYTLWPFFCHIARFCHALWAKAQDLFMRNGPKRQTNYQSAKKST
jgi:hypothetical protein